MLHVPLPNVTDSTASEHEDDFLNWGAPIDIQAKTLAAAWIELTWSDQGWGDAAGAIGVDQGWGEGVVVSGRTSHCCAPHVQHTETVMMHVNDLLNDGRAVQPIYRVGPGGDHVLYLANATLVRGQRRNLP